METIKCPACGCPRAKKNANYESDSAFYICPVCGRYELTIDTSLDKNKLGAYLYYNGFVANKKDMVEYRYHTTMGKEQCDEYSAEFKNGNNQHGHPVHMDTEIINAWYPRSFAEKVDRILLKLDELSDYVGQEIIISKYAAYGLMFAVQYQSDGKERINGDDIDRQVFFFLKYLNDFEYIDIKGSVGMSGDEIHPITITPNGYKRIDQLQRNVSDGRDVLVAMQFGDDTMALREAIKQGIRDAGFTPILIDEVEHNGFITPELLSHIKKSKFVVVDLTHQNNGAYFEEGYAMGLGKPVIQLCKKDVRLHFDIAQKNTIIWKDESEIPLRLKNRITATID